MTDHRIGWRVHGWCYPAYWWMRRKPRSNFRQRLVSFVDALDWEIRIRPRIRRLFR